MASASAPDVGEHQPGGQNAPAVDSAVPPESDDKIIARLAKLSRTAYERARIEEAKRLGMRASVLDKIVASERQRADEAGKGIGFDEVEPWPEPVAGDQLLSDIATAIARFIICKPETIHAAALWIAMSWLIDDVDTAPLAVITAPEKRCGKSQLLTVMGRLSCRPVVASNISPAALYRVIEAWQPTLMIDEADAFMRENEELRGIINSGHKRDSAYVMRTVGDDFTPRQFSTWGAKAIAGIGHLSDTIMDRAIVLDLRRKLPHESVERLRYAEPDLFPTLAARLARWSGDNRALIRASRPELPTQLNDRAQDNWEPLLAIADVAGGAWPERARHAALIISGGNDETLPLGAELLADILEVFETKQVERISTADLIAALIADDEKTWATYNRGKPISPRQMAKRLKEYGIVSKNVRVGYGQAKGFDRLQFQDVFERYLAHTSETPPIYPSHRPKSLQALPLQGLSGTDIPESYVPKNAYPSQSQIPVNHAGYSGTDKGLGRWDGYEKNGTDDKYLSVPRKPSDGKEWDVGTDKKGGCDDSDVFAGLHVTQLSDGRIEVEI